MTNIRDGNIYEVMRIILPEHRKKMKGYEREREVFAHQKPLLSEDQYAEFSQTISDAVLEGLKIRVTLYNQNGDEDYEGVPIMDSGRLRLVLEDYSMPILMDRVVNIVLV